jgi:hypothetical protein
MGAVPAKVRMVTIEVGSNAKLGGGKSPILATNPFGTPQERASRVKLWSSALTKKK